MSAFLAPNIHPLERGLRLVIGGGLLVLAFVGPQTPLGYLGVIPLLTAFTGNCPLYSLVGFSTCRLKAR